MSEYFTRADGINGTTARVVLGWLMILLGLTMLLTLGSMGYYIGIGVLVLYLASWSKKNPLVTLKEDHLDMKAAWLAGRRLIRYTDISALEQEGSNKAWLTLRDGSRVRLPWVALDEARRSDFARELTTKLGHTAQPKAA